MKPLFPIIAGIIFLSIALIDGVAVGVTWDNTWHPMHWFGKMSYIMVAVCLITVFYLGLKKKR